MMMLPPAKTQSTPKTSAAQRFQARYIANSTPYFSPKKRLDFDSHDSSNSVDDGSPKLRSTRQEDEEQCTTPTTSTSRFSFHEDLDSSSATIKPTSLVSKFDCFS